MKKLTAVMALIAAPALTGCGSANERSITSQSSNSQQTTSETAAPQTTAETTSKPDESISAEISESAPQELKAFMPDISAALTVYEMSGAEFMSAEQLDIWTASKRQKRCIPALK